MSGTDNEDIAGYAATVGTFDGMHTGHLYLLEQLEALAAHTKLAPLAFVLDPHPLSVVRPERVPPQLCNFARRKEMIEKLGVKVCHLAFDERMRSETSDEFIGRIHDEMGVKALLVGHDNRFGSDREHGFEHYREVGSRLGVNVVEAQALPGVSSSQVRKRLSAGLIEEGNSLLGYTYYIEGEVHHGKALGRTLGYPTANIILTDSRQLLPPAGVYATVVSTDETGLLMPSMTNIGYRPTVDGANCDMSIETHIFDFSGDLYGHTVRLYFKGRLRDEQKFDSLDALTSQLALDARQAQEFLIKHRNQ